jgi:hypothetical protein
LRQRGPSELSVMKVRKVRITKGPGRATFGDTTDERGKGNFGRCAREYLRSRQVTRLGETTLWPGGIKGLDKNAGL